MWDDSNSLVVGKMKDEMGNITTNEIVRLRTKMYSILVSNSSEYKTGL